MARESLFIKKEAAKLNKQVARIIKQYIKLDSASYILKTNETLLLKELKKYISKLGIITDFFTGDVMNKLVSRSRKEFYRDLKRYDEYKDVKRSLMGAKSLLAATKKDNYTQVNSLLSEINNRLTKKFSRYKDEIETLLQPLDKFYKEAGRIPNILVKTDSGIQAVDRVTAEKTWKKMNRIYGEHDKLLYRKSVSDPFQPSFIGDKNQGKLYPMRSYVDAKTITITRETQNNTTIYEGQANGVMTGKITHTGTDDSCILWEGKTIFLSDASKELFLAQYGNKIPVSKNWKTYNEVKNDRTHMFVFGCKHRLRPLPLQLFIDDLDKDQIQPSPTIPITNKGLENKTKELVDAA